MSYNVIYYVLFYSLQFEYKNAQLESRERERDILQSRRIDGDRDEMKQQRDEYEAKYSKLMDDYRVSIVTMLISGSIAMLMKWVCRI